MHPSPASRRLAAGVAAVLTVGAAAGCARQLLAHDPESVGAVGATTCMRTNPKDAPAISWRRTAAESDLPTLDAWCAAVGPADLDVPVQAGEYPAMPSDSLVVVSWNVHVGGGDLARFVGDLRSGKLTGGAPVHSFVLLLQEAHRAGVEVPSEAARGSFPKRILVRPPAGDRVGILLTARALGLHVLYAPSMRNGGEGGEEAEDRGNAILSTLPLSAPEAIELPYESQRRVAVAGTIAGVGSGGSAWSLRVVSAHLDNRSRGLRDSFGAGRARQARALVEAVADEHAVIGADLNTWSAGFLESALPILMEKFPGSPAGPTGTFRAGGVLPRTLDHLMFRLWDGCQTQLQRAPERYGSDHFPVIGVVRLPA